MLSFGSPCFGISVTIFSRWDKRSDLFLNPSWAARNKNAPSTLPKWLTKFRGKTVCSRWFCFFSSSRCGQGIRTSRTNCQTHAFKSINISLRQEVCKEALWIRLSAYLGLMGSFCLSSGSSSATGKSPDRGPTALGGAGFFRASRTAWWSLGCPSAMYFYGAFY